MLCREKPHSVFPCSAQENSGPLKILIASTPKTGNTWLKSLLAELYDLPIRGLPLDPVQIDWTELGESWVAHQHYLPTSDLLQSLKERGVHVVTTVRHPADTFISLFHHVDREGRASDRISDAEYMLHDHGSLGLHALEFLKVGFAEHLNLSIAWVASHFAKLVRYEDLCERPLETLSALAGLIQPMPRRRIRQTLCWCEMESMRRRHGDRKDFFRRGGTGGWSEELPETFRAVLRNNSPFPEQFVSLGYPLESNGIGTRPTWRAPCVLKYPLRGKTHFENGVAVVPLLIQIFFEVPETISARWEDLSTGHGTFWSWLNQPAEEGQQFDGAAPVITELAFAIYRDRPDVRAIFPEVFGRNCSAYCEWFLHHALTSYGLSDAFGLSIFRRTEAAARGGPLPFPLRPGRTFEDETPIPAILIGIYYSLSERQTSAWKNPLSTSADSFFEWLKCSTARDPSHLHGRTTISELAWQVYSRRHDVQQCYPDIFGTDRDSFAQWFRERAPTEHEFSPILLEPSESALANDPSNSPPDTESDSGAVEDGLLTPHDRAPSAHGLSRGR